MISQFVYKQMQPSHVTKAAGIEVFLRSQKMWLLSREQIVWLKDRSWKSRSIQEHSLTELAPCLMSYTGNLS